MCRRRGSSCRLKHMNVKWVSVSLSWCGLNVQFALWTQSSAREDERLHEDVRDHWNVWKHLETWGQLWESVSVISTGNLIKAKRSLNSKQKQLVSTDRLVLVSSSCSDVCVSLRRIGPVSACDLVSGCSRAAAVKPDSTNVFTLANINRRCQVQSRSWESHAGFFLPNSPFSRRSAIIRREIRPGSGRDNSPHWQTPPKTRMQSQHKTWCVQTRPTTLHLCCSLRTYQQQPHRRGRGESSGKVHFTSSTSNCDDHVNSSSHFTRRR